MDHPVIHREIPLRGGSETERLVSGGHRYVADHICSEHVWARVVRSNFAHGRLVGIETSDAVDAEGVLAVLTAIDFVEPVPSIPLRGSGPWTADLQQPVLASDRVRYVGEPVAVVIAETAHLAEDAAELVRVEIEPLAVVTHTAQRTDHPDDRGDGSGRITAIDVCFGDVASAFDRADLVVRGRYSNPRLTGAPIELRGLVAEWDDEVDGGPVLHLWGPTKNVFFTQRTVASLLGIELDQVVIHGVDVGGAFGVRGEFYPEDFLIPWAARRVGRGVAWVEDRREHMLAMNHSRQQEHDYELAVTRNGDLLAFRDVVSIDAGAYARPIGIRQASILMKSLPGPYRWEAMEMQIDSVTTNKTPVGNLRGPGGTEATFVRERAIDRAARQLDIDPIEIRRRNLISHAQLPYVVELEGSHPEVIAYDSGDYEAILDSFLDVSDLKSLRNEISRRRGEGESIGLGIALFVEHSGTGITETVRVDLAEDGLLIVKTGACDLGQGLTEFILRVCEQELGIGADHVRVLSGDSRSDVDARGTFGSRTAIFVGNAVADAIAKLRAEAISRAASILGGPTDEIQTGRDGLTWDRQFLHWKEVAPIGFAGVHEGELTWGFGGHIALVTVDIGTFDVQVERLAVTYDCGRIINPQAVEGQLRGGSVFGLGGALFEEIPYDEQGQPLATNLMDYLLPTYRETPSVQVFAVESEPAPGNYLGVKGAAEAGVIGVGGAVANAVADALGTAIGDRIVELPLRPDRLLDLVDSPSDSSDGS
ncbi:MAG: xanthine dehydrogenase family protein molybdopterin-binding subunit [Acidimicrobiia bacterium]|nr:xanthine dehydrogenase family protein molybdopterin-binding subunit [Acidimicrobiia bacterium]